MKFRLRAFATHLAWSAVALTVALGTLYAGWYRWPGWFLADAPRVFGVLIGVDLVLGPLLTLVVASPAKSRRVLSRDIGVIVLVQFVALSYGVAQLWNGRILYYAFSESILQAVQAYDIPAEQAALGAQSNAAFAPHWYSLPRWIWAPLPQDPKDSGRIIGDAVNGGTDVVGMPRFYQPWEAGLPALRQQLKRLDEVSYFFPKEKQVLREKMRQQGLAPDEPICMTFVGRGHWLLAVFDPQTLRIKALLRAR